MHGWRIGKIFGITIEINFTWLIIFGMILWLVTQQELPGAAPDATTAELWITGIITTLLFFGSLLLHEIAHSVMANSLGAGVSRITLFLFGGVSQMKNEPNSPMSEFKIAIVGPLTSVVLGGVFIGLHFAIRAIGLSGVWAAALLWVGDINIALAIFNMLPAFPLDGGRVLRSILWGAWNNLERATHVASSIGRWFGYAMIGLGLLGIFAGNLNGLWFVGLGWLLSSAAAGSYQQMQLRNTLGGVHVHDIMSSPVQTIPGDVSLAEAAQDHFMTKRFSAFGVEDENGRITGLIRMKDLQGVLRDRWSYITVRDAMQPLDREAMMVRSDDEAVDAMMQMARNDLGRLLVTDGSGEVVGIISLTDIQRLVKVRGGLGV